MSDCDVCHGMGRVIDHIDTTGEEPNVVTKACPNGCATADGKPA